MNSIYYYLIILPLEEYNYHLVVNRIGGSLTEGAKLLQQQK